jgi:hypothetical protein
MQVKYVDAFCVQLVKTLGQGRSELFWRVLAGLMRVVLCGKRKPAILPFRLRRPGLLFASHVRPRRVNLAVAAGLEVVEARGEIVKVDDAGTAFLVGPNEVSVNGYVSNWGTNPKVIRPRMIRFFGRWARRGILTDGVSLRAITSTASV